MATAALRGDAFFQFDLPVDPFGTAVHTLANPLAEVRTIDRRRRYDWWAEDLVNREIVFTGAGVTEIMGTIRFEDEPEDLRLMLRLALQYNMTLTYWQNGDSYPVKLVAVVGATDADETPLDPDRDRYGYGEWECRVHLRRIDGGTLEGILECGSS